MAEVFAAPEIEALPIAPLGPFVAFETDRRCGGGSQTLEAPHLCGSSPVLIGIELIDLVILAFFDQSLCGLIVIDVHLCWSVTSLATMPIDLRLLAQRLAMRGDR